MKVINFKQKSILFIDYGLNTEFAARLARDFGKVYFWTPWQSAFSSFTELKIGKDFDGLIRVEEWEPYKDKVDLICIPDTGFGGLIDDLRKQGKRVWGTGRAELMEFERWKMRKLQKAVGLPTQNTLRIKSLDDLLLYFKGIRNVVKELTGKENREIEKAILLNLYKKYDKFSENYYIGDNISKTKLIQEWIEGAKNKYIKSRFRGTIETFFADSYKGAISKFNKLQKDLGHSSRARDLEFIVEDYIEGVEPGGDHIQIDGEFLSPTMWGYEVKGIGYAGIKCDWEEIPEPVREVSEKLGIILKKLSPTRNNFSTELIVSKKDRKPYLIDPCPRIPLPTVGAIQTEFITNWAEIVWYGAEGIKVEPKFLNYKYCAAISCDSEWANENELEVSFECPRNRIKFRKAYKKEGRYYAVEGFSSICSIIGFGNTLKEAIEEVKKHAQKVSAYQLQVLPESLDKVKEEIERAQKEYGLSFN